MIKYTIFAEIFYSLVNAPKVYKKYFPEEMPRSLGYTIYPYVKMHDRALGINIASKYPHLTS